MFRGGVHLLKNILAVDVGAGTQDILLYQEGIPVENCTKLVLPSQTRIVAGQIAAATAAGEDICLVGRLMGGGPSVRAIKEHMAAGLKVCALPDPARTIRDDPKEVAAMGVQLVDSPPLGCREILMQDFDPEGLGRSLERYGIEVPGTVALAVQDHGECLGMSNRKFRFQHWEHFLEAGGTLADLLYHDELPAYLTRMQAVREAIPGAYLMDTGSAAVWGALVDPLVADRQRDGLLLVNLGNQHTLAMMVKGSRIWGVFEHHTTLLTADKLKDYLHRFIRRQVSNQEVYDDCGHGCAVDPDAPDAEAFSYVAVTGPQRSLARDIGYFAVPGGDMMISGCFGLVSAVRESCRQPA
jgi:uncharacterized protein (DUF1786 family)